MKKTILLVALFAICLVLPNALAVSGAFVNKSGSNWTFTPNIYYAESYESYFDVAGSNPDLGIAACSIADGSKYAGAAYAANVSGTWTYVLVSYDPKNLAPYAAMDQDISSICAGGYASNPDALGLASSTHTDYTPPVYIAAFPGNMYLLVDSTNSSAPDAIYSFNNSRGKLLGSYNGVSASYNQTTHNVAVDFSSITFYKSATETLTKAKNDLDHGISDRRMMVIASCTDQYGANCSDAKIVNATPQLPVQLASDITSPSDDAVYIRYAVINGIGTPYCVGPELQAYNVSLAPENPLYSQAGSVNITITINNNGDVNVTHPFNVSLWEDGVGGASIQNLTFDSLPAGSSNTTILTGINLPNKASGVHTININVDNGAAGIDDCNPGNNQMFANFTIIKVYYLDTYINGTAGTDFPQVGKPYNFSVHATDSDGNDISNGTVHVVEKNGANLVPMQFWNDGSDNVSVVPYSIAEVKLDSSGWRNFTVIPTGNKMIADEPDIANYYTGNYSLYVELYTPDGNYRLTKNLTVGSLTPDDPTQQISVNNQDIINSAYDLVYRIYSTVKRWLNY